MSDAIKLADEWDNHTSCDGDDQKIGDAMAAELRRLAAALCESRTNDRTAMGYLAEIRAIVGGDDFPAMVGKVRELAAKCAPVADEREAFEVAFTELFIPEFEAFTRDPGKPDEYDHFDTHMCWMIWRARAARDTVIAKLNEIGNDSERRFFVPDCDLRAGRQGVVDFLRNLPTSSQPEENGQ